ncbi:MAG: citramalate synthase [Spirochaetales bacterium]|nr:citramalate synthase [Spirochaetales bacterium]
MNATKIEIYDTTLRDGMQGIEINFTLKDKLEITHKLDDMGIDYIEGGFPLANDKEEAFFNQMKKETLSHAKLVAFGSTRKPGGKAQQDAHIQALLNAETQAVIVVGKTWLEHVEKVLGTHPEENLEMIHDSISYLSAEGREVLFDLEHFFDGFKDNTDYALKVLQTATDAGAKTLVLCDTNGGTLPNEVTTIVGSLSGRGLASIGVHFHNDCGVAVANSLLGIYSGALQVQGTINGWGERCGNANLCAIIPNICLKTKEYTANVAANLSQLTALSRFVAEKANIIPEKRQPYVGEAAFSHKAGQHADVIAKAPQLMEHISGSLVGNTRRILLSELAGKSTIVEKLEKYGTFDKKSTQVDQLISLLKEKENAGYEYEAAEASFDLLIRKILGKYVPLVELNNYHLESFKTGNTLSKTVGRLFLTTSDNQVMGAGVGVGPVETLDQALRDAVKPFHPFIDSISLIDYKVRVLNPEEAAASKVRVFITSTDHQSNSWDTVGVSENIVEASWEAIVESFEYYYNNFVIPQ